MFYRLAIFVLDLLSHLLFRVKVEGRENIPAGSAFILCANHATGFDPIFLGVTAKRELYFMAKKELFSSVVSKNFFDLLHAFPVDRGAADIASFKMASKLLSEGKALLIFAQGTRAKELDIKSAKSGAALFAIKNGVPVVPAGISASYKFFAPVRVRYGKPIDLAEYKGVKVKAEVLDEATEKIMTRIKELTDQG
jgi:1-acyl-sn-glycerol-3-phosphate acyltransferase